MKKSSAIKREIGPIALLFTGIGSIIGSGWLFGAWKAAEIAGPAAIIAWVVGAIIILAIALTYTELGVMFPESGGMVRYARYSHGALVGFFAGWANWIAIVSVIPIEAEASIQYMSSWPFEWAHQLYVHDSLTLPGLILSAVLVVIYFLLNYWSVKLFARVNSLITIFKFLVPGLTIIGLFCTSFHSENLGSIAQGTFMPYGLPSILTAIATSGIVFAFNGFQSPINLAGEAKNPSRSIPFAVICSILVTLAIYVLLQIVYLGAVNPHDLQTFGWNHLDFSSPFAQLAIAVNLNWLVILLYLDAYLSPSGTAVTYMATTSRMLYAMSRQKVLPAIFSDIHPFYGVPRKAMWFNLFVSFVFLFFFRGWGSLAAVISVATVITYLTGPTSLMALRHAVPDLPSKMRLRSMVVIAPFAFVCSSLILYWARWPLTGKIIILILVALPVYLYYQNKTGWGNWKRDFQASLWFIFYLPSMALLSFIGSKQFHGLGILPYGWDMVVVAIVAFVFYCWAVRSGYRTEYLTADERDE